ncbi:MAG: ABC transporter substrate-binding protein [Planctomycetota bacterium]
MRWWALVFLWAACGREPSASARGVVSLLPSWTEIIAELGAADRLVGCTEACAPECAVPRVPWRGPQAAESIVRLRPALVVRQASRAARDPLHHALARAGIEVLSLPSETIADVRDAIVRIGHALGRERAAGAYRARFDAALEQARAGAQGAARPRVLFVFGRDADALANIDGAGPGTFLDELIRYAGGRNVLEEMRVPYPRIRLETVVRLKPDVIIDNVPGAADPRAQWERLRTVPAVRDGRIFAVKDRDLLIPGPHLPRSVERMVEMIHGRP